MKKLRQVEEHYGCYAVKVLISESNRCMCVCTVCLYDSLNSYLSPISKLFMVWVYIVTLASCIVCVLCVFTDCIY